MPGSLSNKISRATDSDTGRPVIATLASPGKATGAASITISDATNWSTASKLYFSIYNLTSTGYKDATTQTDWVGTLAGTTLSNLTLTGGTDRAYLAGAIVEQTITGKQLKDLYDLITAQHNLDSGAHTSITTTAITNNGNYSQSSGTFSAPSGSIPPSSLGLTHATDANGWIVYDYGAFKQYKKRGSKSITVNAGAWTNTSSLTVLPVGITSIGTYLIDGTASADDQAIRCQIRPQGYDTNILATVKNDHTGTITTTIFWSVTLTTP